LEGGILRVGYFPLLFINESTNGPNLRVQDPWGQEKLSDLPVTEALRCSNLGVMRWEHTYDYNIR